MPSVFLAYALLAMRAESEAEIARLDGELRDGVFGPLPAQSGWRKRQTV